MCIYGIRIIEDKNHHHHHEQQRLCVCVSATSKEDESTR